MNNPPFSLNEPLQFFGVDDKQFKLGGVIYEAIEDPDDGYRSYLKTIKVLDADLSIFFHAPLDIVRVEELTTKDRSGWKLVSVEDGHIWLEVGTDNADAYYPLFLFQYSPRHPQTRMET